MPCIGEFTRGRQTPDIHAPSFDDGSPHGYSVEEWGQEPLKHGKAFLIEQPEIIWELKRVAVRLIINW